jgi:hypothetical protein
VFLAAWKLGVPWLGLIHDWSKFLPSEFFAYARNYYDEDGTQRPRDCVRTDEYAAALVHHLNFNKHHPPFWVLYGDPIPMPDRYRREMLADWFGYEGTNGKPTREMYLELRDQIELHPSTRAWVDEQLEVTDDFL